MSDLPQRVTQPPQQRFATLDDVDGEYAIFDLIDFDYEHESEILQIYNNEIQYDETANHPVYLLPHFSQYALRHESKGRTMQILRKLSQTNNDLASNLMVHVHFEFGHATQGKKCIKQRMKRNCGKSYYFQFKQKMHYIEKNPNLKLSKRNTILGDAMKCLNIAFSLGFMPAINVKYNFYMNFCKDNNIPFDNTELGEISKHFVKLGNKRALNTYAMHLFDTSRYAESKQFFVSAMESDDCCLPMHATFCAHEKYVFLKKKGIIADFFSEQEIMEYVEKIVIGQNMLPIGMEPVDNPAIELIEYCAKRNEFEKCADILKLIGRNRDEAKEILPTLFSIVKTYSLTVPKNLLGWYQYENHCNNVVAEYECQFCMETVTSFVPFGCENQEHGCCTTCFNKCSVCPYKCVEETGENEQNE